VSVTNAPGAEAYPISSFTWLLIKKEGQAPEKAKAIWSFVEWMTGPEAQRMAADLHYAPLPVPVIELVRQKVVR
jgi:phosphate transport system substrate-binding protein